MKWEEVFYVLEVVGGKGVYYTVREAMEQQVMRITKLGDLVKLRALAKLCSMDFFNDQSLLVVAWRRILEILELAMLEEKKARGKKKQKKNDPRRLEILDACFTLGLACNHVGDFDDSKRYYKRAKEGYEEQLGRDSEKALEATSYLIMTTCSANDEVIEKLRDLLKRMEKALGEENVVTLETLNDLGCRLKESGEYEETIKIWERCLAGGTKVIGEDHAKTLDSLNNRGAVYGDLKNYEKALKYFERALKGYERKLVTSHPETLDTVTNIAILYKHVSDYAQAEPLFERAFEGYEAQLGKDHNITINCAKHYGAFLEVVGNEGKLVELRKRYAL
ncbi:hypothetical protein TL16_g02709 [Triparma laevis f. inornata]|uniref:Kinesin light chain n=1 Tax=Triparma laevis f. inornata TaxID=1714386 RepID=A0A9W7DYM8_9STRA|nr:hypothetical protein TL16_g02709 [Triparma laevis f. inornata]